MGLQLLAVPQLVSLPPDLRVPSTVGLLNVHLKTRQGREKLHMNQWGAVILPLGNCEAGGISLYGGVGT